MTQLPLFQPWHLVRRDSDGVAHVVGLSGGKDSTCLALALREREPRPYNYLYTPTGDELPEMEAHMRRLEVLLGQPIIRMANGTLKTVCEQSNMLPSFHARFCTRMLKLRPAGDFYRLTAPIVAYVGLRDDEDEREGLKPGRDAGTLNTDVVQDYPFQRWGWDEDDVWHFLDERGVTIPQRTDCARCPYQKVGEWFNLWKDHPTVYADAEADEARYGATFRSPTGNHGPWPHDLKSLRLEFENGRVPERSLRMMEKRRGMCRACSL